jgi:RNA polymerase sigma factor (sigma-70 family)
VRAVCSEGNNSIKNSTRSAGMGNVTTRSVVRQIESLYGGASIAGLSDRQLVERFVMRRDKDDEDAFAALVARHGPMVLGVCQKLLGDCQQAEDAFQAVFLVLARKARSVRDPDLLCNWLYGVAVRTARKARTRLARQKRTEEDCAVSHPEASTTMAGDRVAIEREHAETLHAEIERLPGLFRVPVVLCYFEGLTLDQAALRLGCPAGTVHSRLARARDKLRRGLTRRGVVMPATALAAALATRPAVASVSSQLCETTARAAIEFAAGRSVATLGGALAQEVLRAMFFHKVKFIPFTLLLLGAVATSAGYLTHALAGNDEPTSPLAIRQTPVVAKPDDTKPAPGRMFVTGRVLDPQGQPVPGATVMASVRVKFSLTQGDLLRPVLTEIGHAEADGAGRFRVDAPRTSSSRNDEFVALALAPGFGAGWVKIDPDADQPAADITLQSEQVIQGRLFDVQGRPVQGVAVSVSSIERELVDDSGRFPMPGTTVSEGPIYEWTRVNDIPAWPKPAITDADGRFTIRGVGRRLKAGLSIIDPRFALRNIEVEKDDAPGSKLVTETLEPAKVFIGRVTDAETGKPVPHARLVVHAAGGLIRQPQYGITRFQADANGRFRANPARGERFQVLASPPDGKTYLQTQKSIDWPKGALEQTVDLALTRGAVIRGTVVEEGSGRAIAGASVAFIALALDDVRRLARVSKTLTAADGSFELAALPRAGHLAIQAPNDDYILREMGVLEISPGTPGGPPRYSNSFIACEPKLSGPALDFRIALRRGVTVTGRIVGPDDQPVQGVWIIGRTALAPDSTSAAFRGWRGSFHAEAPAGRFELHGLDPDVEIPVHFLEPRRRLGAMIRMSGKSASGGPLTVHLNPCGAATARLVDAQGRPVAGYGRNVVFLIRLVITPGPEYPSRDPEESKRLSGESDSLGAIDPINYTKPPGSDEKGRIDFPALIPGATYSISDYSVRMNANGAIHVRKEFTVKPGETLDLGDILIEKPVSGN